MRWIYQEGVISLPKSTNIERMEGNIDIFDFERSKEDIEKIANLDMEESAFFDYDGPQQVEWFMNRMLDTEINVD